jgi:hypothetical protein
MANPSLSARLQVWGPGGRIFGWVGPQLLTGRAEELVLFASDRIGGRSES